MKNSGGFTLIEVMIAAVILFSAIAVTADLYKSTLLSADKAANSAAFYQIHPVAISAIKSNLLELHKKGSKPRFSGQLSIMGIQYQWTANRTSFKSRAQDVLNIQTLPNRFSLYHVAVEASRHQKKQQFTFEAAAW